ncbi:MAG: hypothetical protein ACSHYB_16425 [Roseibacillus sp.]
MNPVVLTLCLLIASQFPSVAITVEKVSVDATKEIRASLDKIEEIYVFEGLPHQRDAELLQVESKREDTTSIGGFQFYTPKVLAKGEVAREMRNAVRSAQSYTKWSGEKRCGGFHPDYAIAWSEGANEYSILICYGCREVLVVSARESFRYDFSEMEELKKLLVSFKSKRPEKQKG